MKTLSSLSLLAVLSLGSLLAQQNTLVQTSLSAAVVRGQQSLTVASATGITVNPPTFLLIERDMYFVTAVNGLAITATGGQVGTFNVGHPSGDMVLVGRPDWFTSVPPQGACVTANVYVSPVVNYITGFEHLCSSVLLKWVPGFQNPGEPGITTAVASAAGLVTPSGPLFHVTGALAITGFNIPVGFTYGQFCAVPDAAFTTTNANNIAIASTGVIGKLLCWAYDPVTLKFYPSY